MSDYVTWEDCPRCGHVAAVGWVVGGIAGEAAGRRVEEFDCSSGCQIDLDVLTKVFGWAARRTPPAAAEESGTLPLD